MFGLGKNKFAPLEDFVDPIAEAEVYFAYGRDDAAIKILQDAYNSGDNELKSRINSYLDKNKKSHLLKKSDLIRFQYRVHCVEYLNGYSTSYKFFVNVKNPKNTLNGMRDIENEAENKINRPGAHWTITFISDALE